MTRDRSDAPDRGATARSARHLRVARPSEGTFEDLVLAVQLEHELAGFETIARTRIDELVGGHLGDDVSRTAMILVCHAAIARDAVDFDPRIAGLFPCTTVVYERETDGSWHVYHASAMQATHELGFFPDADAELSRLVAMTSEQMDEVWAEIESRYGTE